MGRENEKEIGKHKGKLTVITGDMFSGKTGELSEQVNKTKFAGKKFLVIKPANDKRYSVDDVVTHNGDKIQAFKVKQKTPELIHQILEQEEAKVGSIYTVGIDEIQFFAPKKIVRVVEELINKGKNVVVAGLPTDFRDTPFGAMPQLLAKADTIIQKFAVCTYVDGNGNNCGEAATKTQRLIDGKPARYDDTVIVVGGREMYEARCRDHHQVIYESAPEDK